MLIKELIESNDPIMDLVRAKEAGFSPDSIDAITDRLTAAMATPVTKPNITAQALPKTSQPNKPLATTAKPVAKPIAIATLGSLVA